MSHETDKEIQRMPERKIYVDAGVCSGVPDHYGFLPGAFLVKLVVSEEAHEIHGMGRVRNTQLLYAHGMIMVLDHLAREEEAPQLSPIDIICGSPDFWQRLVDTWNSELSQPSKVLTADQHAVWRQLADLAGRFSLQPPRGPLGTKEAAELAKVKAGRVRYAQQAVDLPRDFFGIRTGSGPS